MKKPLPNLAALVASIQSGAAVPTHRIVSTGPVPLSSMMPAMTEVEHKAPIASTVTDVTPAGFGPSTDLDAQEIAKLESLVNALRAERDDARTALALANEYGNKMGREVVEARTERDALARELAEARNDRRAEVRTAATTLAMHFNGPQGLGTADRIKAVGGRWRFHAKAVKDQFTSAGYWLLPDNGEANALLADLRAEGKAFKVSNA